MGSLRKILQNVLQNFLAFRKLAIGQTPLSPSPICDKRIAGIVNSAKSFLAFWYVYWRRIDIGFNGNRTILRNKHQILLWEYWVFVCFITFQRSNPFWSDLFSGLISPVRCWGHLLLSVEPTSSREFVHFATIVFVFKTIFVLVGKWLGAIVTAQTGHWPIPPDCQAS